MMSKWFNFICILPFAWKYKTSQDTDSSQSSCWWCRMCLCCIADTPQPEHRNILYSSVKCIILFHRTLPLSLYFSNGGLDPWSSGGVTYNITDSLVSIMIPDGAHHLDLRYSNDHDPPSVHAARALEVKYFREWIRKAKKTPQTALGP